MAIIQFNGTEIPITKNSVEYQTDPESTYSTRHNIICITTGGERVQYQGRSFEEVAPGNMQSDHSKYVSLHHQRMLPLICQLTLSTDICMIYQREMLRNNNTFFLCKLLTASCPLVIYFQRNPHPLNSESCYEQEAEIFLSLLRFIFSIKDTPQSALSRHTAHLSALHAIASFF